MPDPKPPYNTVVTTIRNLEKKGFVQQVLRKTKLMKR